MTTYVDANALVRLYLDFDAKARKLAHLVGMHTD
jgi:hypothetical protein